MSSRVGTVSLDHVRRDVEGGSTRHGRDTRLRRLRRGDAIVFSSPRTALRSGEPLQRFTAVGRVADDEPYRVELAPDLHPWRRRVDFVDAHPADVRPLLPALSFVTDERRWGLPFRRGLFEVADADLAVIAGAMGARL